MTTSVKKSVITFLGVFFATVTLTGCVIHIGSGKANASMAEYSDYSEVNKSIKVSEGRNVGDVSSVNGSISIEDNVTAEEVSTVNGRLRVGENVTVEELSTVNGKIVAGEGLKTSDDVSTVNGGIELNERTVIGGNVSTVNGNIDLAGVVIEKNIETVNASIVLGYGTHIKGDIIYKGKNKDSGNWKNKQPKLTIEDGVRVEGSIIIEREVDFDFEDSNMMDKVVRNY